MDYKHILAATDFSETGDAAVARAAAIAAGVKAELTVIYVMEPPPSPSPLVAHFQVVTSAEEETKAIQTAKDELRKRVPAGLSFEKAPEFIIRQGTAAEEIVATAEKVNADLLVLATEGHGRLHRMLIGSVTERVIRMGHRSVLIVHGAHD